MRNKLINWITGELDRRSWSQRELARRAGIDVSGISTVLSEQRAPTFDFCEAIAKPLDCDPVEVFRIAGLISGHDLDVPGLTPEEAQIIQMYRAIPPGKSRDYVRVFIKSWLEQLGITDGQG